MTDVMFEFFSSQTKTSNTKSGPSKNQQKQAKRQQFLLKLPSVRFPPVPPGNLPKAAMEAPGFENFEAVFDDPSPSFGQVGELSWN